MGEGEGRTQNAGVETRVMSHPATGTRFIRDIGDDCLLTEANVFLSCAQCGKRPTIACFFSHIFLSMIDLDHSRAPIDGPDHGSINSDTMMRSLMDRNVASRTSLP